MSRSHHRLCDSGICGPAWDWEGWVIVRLQRKAFHWMASEDDVQGRTSTSRADEILNTTMFSFCPHSSRFWAALVPCPSPHVAFRVMLMLPLSWTWRWQRDSRRKVSYIGHLWELKNIGLKMNDFGVEPNSNAMLFTHIGKYYKHWEIFLMNCNQLGTKS